MAGEGKRYLQGGFQTWKPFIRVGTGKTLLELAVESLNIPDGFRVTFVCTKEQEARWSVRATINHLFSRQSFRCRFIHLPKLTRGQAETVYESLMFERSDAPLVIYNCDTIYRSKRNIFEDVATSKSCLLGTFQSTSPSYGYVSLSDTGLVTEVTEKVVVSSNACNGLYTFPSTRMFKDVYDRPCVGDAMPGEKYVGPLYNRVIQSGLCDVRPWDTETVTIGTPEEFLFYTKTQLESENKSGL